MTAAGALVTGMGWCGSWLPAGGGDLRVLTRGAGPAGVPPGAAPPPSRPADPATLAALFPGRWNPRRALPDGLEPLVTACLMALEEAGWWREGMEDPVRGALVLGSDTHPLLAAAGFARELADRGPVGIGPTGFLFSLPSSATAVLGILLGLGEYQATAAEGGLSGFRAVAHALDLLRAGRISRALIAAMSVVRAGPGAALIPGGEEAARAGTLDLAVAFCLDSEGTGAPRSSSLPRIEECRILDEAAAGAIPADVDEIAPAHRLLAAPSLLAVARAIERGIGGPAMLEHREPGRPAVGRIRIVPGIDAGRREPAGSRR